jgi:hypothetical protein
MTSPQIGVKDVVINLYQTGLLRKDVLLGSVTERLLDFEPCGTGKNIVKFLSTFSETNTATSRRDKEHANHKGRGGPGLDNVSTWRDSIQACSTDPFWWMNSDDLETAVEPDAGFLLSSSVLTR